MKTLKQSGFYLNKFYLDMPDLYDKGRSGQLIYADLQSSNSGKFLNTGWYETREIIAKTLEVKINESGGNFDSNCYSMDLQVGEALQRYYFDNLGDRIIFRVQDEKVKYLLKDYFSKYFRHIDIVGDNELLQLKPILLDSHLVQYNQKRGEFKVSFDPKYVPYSNIYSYQWVTLYRDMGIGQCSDAIRLISEKHKWFADHKIGHPPSAAQIVKSFFKLVKINPL